MAAAVAAAHAATRKSGHDSGFGAGLGEETTFAVKTLPPDEERVMAGELSRLIVSAAGKTFKKRFVVLSESSLLIGTSSDELLYQVPLLEISEVKEHGGNREAAKTSSPFAGRLQRVESWSSRVASGLVDLVNNEPSHYFIIHTKLDGSESGRCVFLL